MNKTTKVAIIGLGQIGGSLGKALKSVKRYYIIGVARREETLKKALKINAFDKLSLSLQDVKGCDIVVICTPVDTIIPIYKQLSKIAGKNTIITDAGSVKEQIELGVRSVESGVKGKILKQSPIKTLGDMVQNDTTNFKLSSGAVAVNSTLHTPHSTLPFIPAHPMAGKEKNGIESADASLFKGANVVIIGSHKKMLKNEAIVAKMWEDAGAKIIKMSAKKHDELVAFTSHLPHLIAFSLNKIYKDKRKKNKEIEQIVAGSFKSATRVANSSADMWAPVLRMNAANIKKELNSFIKELENFKKSLNNQSKIKKEILKGR